jgi:hypothetical protein
MMELIRLFVLAIQEFLIEFRLQDMAEVLHLVLIAVELLVLALLSTQRQ